MTILRRDHERCQFALVLCFVRVRSTVEKSMDTYNAATTDSKHQWGASCIRCLVCIASRPNQCKDTLILTILDRERQRSAALIACRMNVDSRRNQCFDAIGVTGFRGDHKCGDSRRNQCFDAIGVTVFRGNHKCGDICVDLLESRVMLWLDDRTRPSEASW